jgi:2-octaprenylphenol hydroxylase
MGPTRVHRAEGAADFDVVIAGGGPVGAALAALLVRHTPIRATRIALLAPDAASVASMPLSSSSCELRVVAVSPPSQRVLQQAGAWQRLSEARCCAIERMRVWHASLPPDGLGTLCFDAAEMQVPALGHMVENDAITRSCLQSFESAGGVPRLERLLRFHADTDGCALSVTLSGGDSLRTRLLIGAEGAQSLVRETSGIAVRRHAYGQSAIVATIATAIGHDHTAWQRFLPTGPVAILPLFDGCSSIVWSADEARAQELLALSSNEFERQLQEATDSVLGAVSLRSQRALFPLRRLTARRLIANRAALIGDAAHQIHPLAGQGANLGLMDAAALCDSIAVACQTHEDIGCARALRHYERQRLGDDTLMSVGMSAFNALFSRDGMAGFVGSRAMAWAAQSSLTRKAFARRALGLSGELPRLATLESPS